MFPDGQKLVTIHEPIPGGSRSAGEPGEIRTAEGDITLNEGRPTIELTVRNLGDRPIQVGSHFHFFECNKELEFERASAYGMRLDIPAGTAVRFEPGEERAVTLVALGGERSVHGLNDLTNGSLDDGAVRARSLELARSSGYRGVG
jgi:urease subunit gamma/beta